MHPRNTHMSRLPPRNQYEYTFYIKKHNVVQHEYVYIVKLYISIMCGVFRICLVYYIVNIYI